MSFTVPFNGDIELIRRLADFPEAYEVYGKMTSDAVGGGKNSFQTPFIGKKQIVEAIETAHKTGIKFNYLLNSSCLGNSECSRRGNRKIIKLIDWVVGSGADSVTVAVPWLLEVIKDKYPDFPVNISTLAGVATPEKAYYWEKLGAERITLLKLDVNRDFERLKNIRARVKCGLHLIVNVNCLWGCPFYISHENAAAHASRSTDRSKGFLIDYCRIKCRYMQMQDPVKLISSSWIRPEDLHYYEDIGIDGFKIIDRGMATDTILEILRAYSERTYEGNLMDLFPDPSKSISFGRKSFLVKARYFLRPFSVNIFKLLKFRRLLDDSVYIDNKKLEGFLEGIKNIDCRGLLCEECGWCRKYFEKAVTVDEEASKRIKNNYRESLENVVSGDIFRYF